RFRTWPAQPIVHASVSAARRSGRRPVRAKRRRRSTIDADGYPRRCRIRVRYPLAGPRRNPILALSVSYRLMPNLLWPGDHRAGNTFTDATVVSALLRVERAWLVVLTNNHIAPPEANVDLPPVDVATLAIDSEDAGNPVVSLVAHVRERLGEPAASWVHRGLTSQDVLDSAMMLCAQDALDTVLDMVRRQLMTLIELAEHHRDTPMLARTLTQPALPTTFGVHVSGWIQSLADAAETVTGVRERLCIQAGGAAGTMA